MSRVPTKLSKLAFERSGYLCSFPGCDKVLTTEEGYLQGAIAHIAAITPAGPRFGDAPAGEDKDGLGNLIVLCFEHHVLIDRAPEQYSAAWLIEARDQHERRVRDRLVQPLPPPSLDTVAALNFRNALNLWGEHESDSSEEFWQKLFTQQPHLIAQAVPTSIVKIGEKCFLGGKGIDNQGGKIVDFLYVVKSTLNLVLVEIKSPATRLVGRTYRSGVYSITEELSGAVVQALTYRDAAMKNFHQLRGDSDLQFSAFNPSCLVIAGNVSAECDDISKKRTFDLFRASIHGVTVLGYDELFEKIQCLLDIVE